MFVNFRNDVEGFKMFCLGFVFGFLLLFVIGGCWLVVVMEYGLFFIGGWVLVFLIVFGVFVFEWVEW